MDNPHTLHELEDSIRRKKKLLVFKENNFIVCREIFSEVAGSVQMLVIGTY
jgi:hypothetical protein